MQFSIIIPVYNVEPYLERCLNSVLCQTFPDFEALLIDDGSTDGSGAICDRYARQDSRFRVFHQENRGLSGARNTGLEHAAGEWLVFVDSDDWVSPAMLDILHRQMLYDHADLYSFSAIKTDENGNTVAALQFSAETETIFLQTQDQKLQFMEHVFLCYKTGWEVCLRAFSGTIIRSNHLRFQPEREVFAEDLLFSLEYLMLCNRYCVMCNRLYYYRQRRGSLINSWKLEKVPPKLTRLCLHAYSYAKANGLHELCRKFYRLYFSLLNHHFQYLLYDCREPEKQVLYPHCGILPRIWLRRIKRSREDWKDLMVNRVWI